MVSNSARRRARRRVAVLSAVAVSGVVAAMPVHSADPDDRDRPAENRDADQTRHCRDRRKPQFRSCLRHLRPEERRFDPEPAVGADRPEERLARAEFRRSAAVHDLGPDELLHRRQQEEQDPLHDPARSDARWRTEQAEHDVAAVHRFHRCAIGGDRAVLGTGRSLSADHRRHWRRSDQRRARYPHRQLCRLAERAVSADRSQSPL